MDVKKFKFRTEHYPQLAREMESRVALASNPETKAAMLKFASGYEDTCFPSPLCSPSRAGCARLQIARLTPDYT